MHGTRCANAVTTLANYKVLWQIGGFVVDIARGESFARMPIRFNNPAFVRLAIIHDANN